jgi:hypothetical protein
MYSLVAEVMSVRRFDDEHIPGGGCKLSRSLFPAPRVDLDEARGARSI